MIAASRRDESVLVVEDDDATAELVSRALRRAGWGVRRAVSVRSALDSLEQEKTRAVLLDYRLPDGEPWPILDAAHKTFPRVPVILVTAMGDERIAAEAIHRGGSDYLIKRNGFLDELPAALDRVVRLADADRANAHLAAIVESSDDAIVGTTVDGTVVSWNAGAERLYGYSSLEIVGRNASILAPSDGVGLDEPLEAARRGETTRQLETTVVCRDGSRVEVSVTICPVSDRGIVVGVAFIGRDITERRRLEQRLGQAQKMDAIGRLAGGIAHDFNNLLTIINGYTELLLAETAESGTRHERLTEVQRAGQRAATLTRQLLAFSRKQEIKPRVVELNGVVAETEKMLRRLVGEDVELKTCFLQGSSHIKADSGQLEQIIVNLAVNARDAMPRGGSLLIETSAAVIDERSARDRPGLAPGPHVVLSVKDTGCGMDRETLSHIFEPFFTTKGPGHGTGLGLATVFGIVKQSGGHIEVESEPWKGATFRIYLPRVDELEQAAEAPPQTRVPQARGETVLVVEDDDQVRGIASAILRAGGYVVLEASGPLQGMEIAQRHPEPIHGVVSDVVMPQMQGPDFVELLKVIRPDVKVLFLSGYTGRGAASSLDPAAPFLEKPFTPNRLLRKVREVLDGPPATPPAS